MMATRADVVRVARSYHGVRWRHQGRTRYGIDCIGLVILVAHELGLSDHDCTDYSRIPDGRQLRQALECHLQPTTDQQPGDVVLMRFAREPQHVGILTDIGLIHAYAATRKVIEHRIDKNWSDRIVAAYSFRGIE